MDKTDQSNVKQRIIDDLRARLVDHPLSKYLDSQLRKIDPAMRQMKKKYYGILRAV